MTLGAREERIKHGSSSKFGDHLPLYRLEDILTRYGVLPISQRGSTTHIMASFGCCSELIHPSTGGKRWHQFCSIPIVMSSRVLLRTISVIILYTMLLITRHLTTH